MSITRGMITALDYCPYPITTDADRFGLLTSSITTRAGNVTVRHGRRTTGDTATILLHGAAGSWTTWTPLLAADSGAMQLTDLVIPDLPGWGDTEPLKGTKAPSIESVADTVAQIARSLGYRRWIVVGHSMGGFIALQLASAEVRSTLSVWLVSATTFSVIESVRHPLTRFVVLPAYSALLQVMRVFGLFGAGGQKLIQNLGRISLLRPLVAPLFGLPKEIDDSVIDALAADVRPRAFALASALAGRYDARKSWSRIDCPVRSVRGDRDVFVTDSDDRCLAGVIRDFAVRVLHHTGHFAHVERPHETLRTLLAAVEPAIRTHPLPVRSAPPIVRATRRVSFSQ